ncbi:MAG TPA: squalene--hopene cyclase [Thermoanaerobaculia bacterium]|nr:squalene--hopene cyclase [Thermoanaerobaculia bacterium]
MTVREFSFPRATADAETASLNGAIGAAQERLFSIQDPDGHWCGELEGDTILESEYLLLLYYLGRSREPRFRKGAEYIRRQQLADGGWAIYAGGPTELSASVKAYFVLKIAGDRPDAPHMLQAREVILAMGGIDTCNSFTKIYLSIFGQYDWAKCPAVPPEAILFPDWFVFNVYKMSYWSRAIVVPLSIIWAFKPTFQVPAQHAIPELRADKLAMAMAPHVHRPRRERFWRGFFHWIDLLLKAVEWLPVKPFRRRALDKATKWITERLEMSGGLGAIFPPIINTVFAFRALGRPPEHPAIQSQLRELERLEIEEGDTLRLQPCFSAVWDTGLAVHALRESGISADDPRVLEGARWLVKKQVTTIGDWKRNNRQGKPAGWYFQYENEFYPDTDDTSEVLLALSGVRFPNAREERARQDAVNSAVSWVLTMQNDDGGWGAFDKGCDNEVFTFIPFADHNAMIDPSCEDITGRTIEALIALGHDPKEPAIRSAIRFLHRSQDPSGTWYGRWGCNYIYGSFLALRGLAKANEDMHDPRYQRTVRWLIERQNEDGGWGELPRSYDEPALKGVGPSTPSQTAWALLSLIVAGAAKSQAVRRGVDYLIDNQLEDGSWRDEHWTATGFPKVFYLRYHLYATYFPLWALSEYRRSMQSDTLGSASRLGTVNR